MINKRERKPSTVYFRTLLVLDQFGLRLRRFVLVPHLTLNHMLIISHVDPYPPVDSGDWFLSRWPWLSLSMTLNGVLTLSHPGHGDVMVAIETLNALPL